MFFGTRLALDRFIKAHPPSRRVSPAPRELVARYDGILPPSLLELWRRKGLGFYGDRQIALIDPGSWQAVLDDWMISDTITARRIPIALTPFGVLIFYRKLAETAGDVGYIDPVSKRVGVLASSLDEFFNITLCEQEALEWLVPAASVRSAREQCGPLARGEAYCVDRMLHALQIVQTERVGAIDMHYCLRDVAAPYGAMGPKPVVEDKTMPAEIRFVFADFAMNMALQPATC